MEIVNLSLPNEINIKKNYIKTSEDFEKLIKEKFLEEICDSVLDGNLIIKDVPNSLSKKCQLS